MDEQAKRWREALLETVEPYRDTPLLLSGGMDSTTLLAAQLELGGKPRCYAYKLTGEESEDLLAARRLCADFDLELFEVVIPRTDGALVTVTRQVISTTRNPRKTAVQCCFVLHFIFAVARSAGHLRLLTGAGGIAEDNRKAKILGARYHEDASARLELEGVRGPNLLGGNPESATETMKSFAAAYDFELVEPYSMQPVANVGLSIPWPEMNRPVQKGIAVRAFPDFFGVRDSVFDPLPTRYHRENSSLQVNGGIRDWHDRLLQIEEQNPGGTHQRVVAIYNRMLREVDGGEQLALG